MFALFASVSAWRGSATDHDGWAEAFPDDFQLGELLYVEDGQEDLVLDEAEALNEEMDFGFADFGEALWEEVGDAFIDDQPGEALWEEVGDAFIDDDGEALWEEVGDAFIDDEFQEGALFDDFAFGEDISYGEDMVEDQWGEELAYGEALAPEYFAEDLLDYGDAMFDDGDLGERSIQTTVVGGGGFGGAGGLKSKKYSMPDFTDKTHENWETKLQITDVDYLVGYTAFVKKYHDQGWGFQKSRVRVALFDSKGQLKATDDLFGIAPHKDKFGGITVEHEEQLLKKWTKGDILKVQSYVGGGGGHSLTVGQFSILIKSAPFVRKTHTMTDFTDRTHANWETKLRINGLKNLKGYRAFVKIFHDQGWGFQKSRVRVALMSSKGVVKATDDLFGIAPHQDKPGGITVDSEPQIAEKFSPGDYLAIQTYVGGGGGHSLTVKGFQIAVDDGKTKEKTHTVPNFKDNTHAHWETKLKVQVDGKLIGYTAFVQKFHDQGWGFQKSRVRLALANKSGKIVATDDLFGIAPHKDKFGGITVQHEKQFIEKFKPGFEILVQSYVGGGGGHSITVGGMELHLITGL